MAFTPSTRARLSPKQVRLLSVAAAHVTEIILEDVVSLSGDETEDTDHLDTAPWLPPRFADRYDRTLLVKMLTCAVVVGHKITTPRDSALACLGEKIAFHMIVGVARNDAYGRSDWAEDDWKGLDDYEEQVLGDADFMLLYDEGHAGEPAGLRRGCDSASISSAPPRFEDWFIQYKDDEPVHPMCRSTGSP